MKGIRNVLVLFLVAALVLVAGYVSAQERGSAAEARELVKKAVAYVKEAGREKALAEFNNPKGTVFIKKDLYIYASDPQGINLAHGMNPAMKGMDLINLKDADGKPFVKEYTERAMKFGNGTIDYKWADPVTKKVAMKSTYFERIDDIIICCGYYHYSEDSYRQTG